MLTSSYFDYYILKINLRMIILKSFCICLAKKTSNSQKMFSQVGTNCLKMPNNYAEYYKKTLS